ncbi:MAG: hypothetical protein VXY92_03475 [Planctomycetota bacterium]|nr:hypothetical protein [Planctomycetota bacterium]
MCWPTTDARGGSLYAALSLLASAPVPAQGPVEPAAAIERWLASEHTSESLMTATVEAVCDAPDGLKVLGKKLQALQVTPGEPRSKGLRSLMPKVALEHLRRTYKSGMTYAGQYGGLASLEPWIGPFLFGLLLDTPEWYPLTFRVRLVPAIRDLQQQLPDAARVAGITRLVEDEREATDLRRALAAALWQWGRPRHAVEFIRELQLATTEGDGEDRVNATLLLADYFNLLREYRRAAAAHRAAQALARGAGVELLPVAWYSAACVHALNGDQERGLEALRRCAEMHASPHLDKSRRLERKLFEQDPEIASLRADPSFGELLELAFGERDDEDGEGGR